jgi:iron complex outermembrane receptor protein
LIYSKDNWEANLMVKNLTDVRAGSMGFDLASFCGCNEVAYKPPRTIEAGFRMKF